MGRSLLDSTSLREEALEKNLRMMQARRQSAREIYLSAIIEIVAAKKEKAKMIGKTVDFK